MPENWKQGYLLDVYFSPRLLLISLHIHDALPLSCVMAVQGDNNTANLSPNYSQLLKWHKGLHVAGLTWSTQSCTLYGRILPSSIFKYLSTSKGSGWHGDLVHYHYIKQFCINFMLNLLNFTCVYFIISFHHLQKLTDYLLFSILYIISDRKHYLPYTQLSFFFQL